MEHQGKTAVWVLDQATMTVTPQPIQVAGAEGNAVLVRGGLAPGQVVVTAGVHVLTSGQKVKLYAQIVAIRVDVDDRALSVRRDDERSGLRSSRLNISRWALEHPALTRYLMVVLMVLGFAAYFQLGQDEDPPFTFRAMVVRAFWPGASAQQMAEQVTDKIEKTLQEVPHADTIRSYTKPGESLTIFQIRDSSPPKEVANVWYQVRKKIGDMRGTLPAGVIGPFFNDEFGDVYGSIYALTSDGFSYEELREHADRVRQRLLQVRDVAKVELFGAQDEKLFVEISQKRLAQLGIDLNQVVAQLGAQNAVEGAGVLSAASDNIQVRIGGQFNSVDELKRFPIRAVNPANGLASSLRLADIAEIRRAYLDPPQTKVRHQGQEVIALGISMAKGGDIIELGKALSTTVALHSEATCRSASRCARFRTSRRRCRARSASSSACCSRRSRSCWRSASSAWACTSSRFASTSGPAWWWASRSRWCWRSPS